MSGKLSKSEKWNPDTLYCAALVAGFILTAVIDSVSAHAASTEVVGPAVVNVSKSNLREHTPKN